MEPFASNLRKRAEELGISNAEAARRMGLSERRYGNYITGRREPDLATLVRIATILETSPNNLLSFDLNSEQDEPLLKQRVRLAVNSLSETDLGIAAVIIEALVTRR